MGYKDREENKIKTFLYCTVQGTVFINKKETKFLFFCKYLWKDG